MSAFPLRADGGSRHVAVATPAGRGAVATVLVRSESGCHDISRFFQSIRVAELIDVPIDRITYGKWSHPDGKSEDLVICRRSETLIEIHCHGGNFASRAIVERLIELGYQELRWQQWLETVDDDPIVVAAKTSLAAATTRRTATILLNQAQGALSRSIAESIQLLQQNQVELAESRLKDLQASFSWGRLLTEPQRVVLSGPPNVGKSSLLNALLGFERSIVYDQPGTTRDALAASTAIDGWPMQLTDTAGLRSTDDSIESEGVQISKRQLASSDLVLLVFDSSQAWTDANHELWKSTTLTQNTIVIFNKADLPSSDSKRPAGMLTSAMNQSGVDELLEAIRQKLVPGTYDESGPVLFTKKQAERVKRACELMLGGDRDAATTQLQQLISFH